MMPTHRTTRLTGILYAEDFGELASLKPPPTPVARPLTTADVDQACIAAVAAAQRAWAESAQERRTTALETVASTLGRLQAAAAAHAEEVADGVARVLLGTIAASLPALCRTHGDAEVRALMREILPVLGNAGVVVVRAHAGVLEHLAADLAGLEEPLRTVVELRAAPLPPGDVRLAWENGGLVRDGAATQAAVQDCLSQLGLIDPPSAPPPMPTAPPKPPTARSPVHDHELATELR